MATLGRLGDQLDQVIAGLARAIGRTVPAVEPPSITFETARAFGDVWALTELWHELEFDRMRQAFGRTSHAIEHARV